jgi:outer membrane protein TolC
MVGPGSIVGRAGLLALLWLGTAVPIDAVADRSSSRSETGATRFAERSEGAVELHEGSTLEDLVRYAEAHNPALGSIHHEHLSTLEGARQAGALPDPRLRLAVAAVPIETRVGPQEAQLSLSQTIPGRGKRRSRSEVVEAAAEVAAREYDAERFRLAFQLSDAYYDLYLLTRSIEITRDNRDILVYLEQAIRKGYETGKAAYADLIRSQVEIGKLENELRSLRDSRAPAEQRLNSLLHRSPGAPLPTPRLPDEPLTLLPEEELVLMLSQGTPDLARLDAQLEREDRLLRLTEVDDRLDWTFSLSYFPTGPAVGPGTPDSGQDALFAGVAVNLPVWKKKYRAAEQQVRESRLATLEQRHSVEDSLRDRLERGLYRFRNADREIRLYRDTLLPKAEQSFEASEAGFRTGTAGVLDLVDAQRVLLQFQLSYERARSERASSIAELRMILGAEVLAIEPGGGRSLGGGGSS